MHEHWFTNIDRLRSPERMQRLEMETLLPLILAGRNFTTALDVGTGSGIFAEVFSQKGLRVVGLDANPQMLTAARKFVPAADLCEGTAENLPYNDQSFDLVFMGLILHEADDKQKAMAEAARVTRFRLAILEWQYKPSEAGPSLDQRITAEELTIWAKACGLPQPQIFLLADFVLYRWDKTD